MLVLPLVAPRLRALLAVGIEASRKRDGYTPGPEIMDVLRDLEAAAAVTSPPPSALPTAPQWVTTEQARELLGARSTRDVLKLAQRRGWPTRKVKGRRLIDRADVDTELEDLRSLSDAERAAYEYLDAG